MISLQFFAKLHLPHRYVPDVSMTIQLTCNDPRIMFHISRDVFDKTDIWSSLLITDLESGNLHSVSYVYDRMLPEARLNYAEEVYMSCHLERAASWLRQNFNI